MKLLRPAIVMTILFVVCFGLAFPGIMYGIGRAFPKQADGSLVTDKSGKVIGSELIGQVFSKPEYFHGRPSAAGNGYDPTSSSGTNLGPTSDKLINGIHKKTADGKDDPSNFDGIVDLAKAYRQENGLAADAPVPADAVTRSGSGLDPQISIENANIQANRVAKARKMTVSQVQELISQNTSGRFLGIYGEPAVNVLRLNLALDGAQG
ncbi:MAG TPA: K(+)-transporting ATPase subunit C [Fimbriimonas sp.]|nr:K(+)-transporting ATPase subunit C [Fimbriimonas sp.]